MNCDTRSFAVFSALDGLLIAAYLSVPVAWTVLLRRAQRRLHLNDGSTVADIQASRDVASVRFLFKHYRPGCFYMEVICDSCCRTIQKLVTEP